MLHKRILIIAGAFALFALMAYGGYSLPRKGDVSDGPKRAAPVHVVPEEIVGAFARQFAALRVTDQAISLPDIPVTGPRGKEARMSDFKGKPLLVNMWATWCAPCIVELPSLKTFADHYKDDLQVIGIALEAGKSQADVAAFVKKLGVGDFAAYADPEGAFAAKLALRGLPTSFLIDRDGLILYRFEGDAVWTSAESKAFFDVFLSNQKSNR